MGIDVETPDPPDLTNRPLPSEVDPADVVDATSDLRREELEQLLRDGAWSEGFEEWSEYTDLTVAEYQTLRDRGLLERLDFYWHPTEGGVRVEVPSLPDELASREAFGSRAATELSDLGETVLEMLEDSYVDWDEEGEDVWTAETFRDETPPEE